MGLKQLRVKQNVKQITIVRKLKTSTGCVSQWEKGKRSPKIEQLPKLADILHCSIEELVFALIITKEQNDEANKNKQSNCVK